MSEKPLPDFRVAQTLAELAEFCGMPSELLKQTQADPSRSHFYVKHEIPKRGRRRKEATRTVWEVPEGPLQDAHKAVARRLDAFARAVEPRYPNAFAYGYVRGRGTRDNAERHCGARLLLRADIKSFFPSIKCERIAQVLEALGFVSVCAAALARFCTIDDALPLGLHGSPLLANLACLDLDDDFSRLATRYGCTYTRYADDMTFSGQESVPERQEVEQILGRYAFDLAQAKFRVTKRGQAHFVTGLSVSDTRAPHVPRSMKKRLRFHLYYAAKYGIEEHLGRSGETSFQKGINHLDGLVRYVSGIEHTRRASLREKWHTILDEGDAAPSYMPRHGRPSRQMAFIVDEAEFSRGDMKYLAVACCTTEELQKVRLSATSAAREYRADPFGSGRPQKVDKKGLHFTDLPETVRDTFTRTMSVLPFRSYVAFSRLTEHRTYGDEYDDLLGRLLRRRLQAADGASVEILIEENTSYPLARATKLVEKSFANLQEANDRRPVSVPTVLRAKKVENPELVLPDFMLGILARYLDTNERRELDKLRFERLRDKFRVILDIDRDLEFSRRRPVVPWDGTAESGAA